MESCVVVWDTGFLEVSAARTHFYNILAPGIFGEMGLRPTKLVQWRVSAYAIHCVVIPTIDHSKTPHSRRNVQSIHHQ